MQVARLEAAGRLALSDEPAPEPGPGESLVRTGAVGLCGSDLHWWGEGGIGDAVLRRPLVLGHEVSGTVVGGPRDGQRVAVDPALPCGSCDTCSTGSRNLCPAVRFAGHGDVDGGMRELLVWPDALLHPLPDALPMAESTLLEPLGVALHAMDLAHVRLASTVTVVGCGPIGLLLVQLARAAGAAVVVAVEPLPHRRAAALAAGADEAHDPADLVAQGVHAHTPGTPGLGAPGADVVLEVVGSAPAVELAVRAARPGGRVALVGIPDDDVTTFPASTARRKGLTLAVVRRMGEVYPRALALVERGVVDLGALVTERFPLARAAEALETAAQRRGLKVVVEGAPG